MIKSTSKLKVEIVNASNDNKAHKIQLTVHVATEVYALSVTS